MSDDEPFYSPTRKPPAPRKPKPGEPLWELRKDHVTWSCELRYHGEWGVEAQILRDGEIVIGRRFDLKVQAAQWADVERAILNEALLTDTEDPVNRDVFGDCRVLLTDFQSSLPQDVEERLLARMTWLHAQLPILDRLFRVSYPPIDVVPAFLIHAFRDGRSYIFVDAFVGARPVCGASQYVVILTAPALLEFDEMLLQALLAHEFLHVVHKTLRAERRRRAGQSVSVRDSDAADRSFQKNRKMDTEAQADPSVWLTADLVEKLRIYDDQDHPETSSARERMRQNWLGRQLPYQQMGGRFTSREDIVLSESIIRRAEALPQL